MFRKTILALAAVATLGVGAIATTSEASAKPWKGGGWHGHHGHWGGGPFWGPRFGFYGVGYGGDCYWVKRFTPYGVKYRRVCY